jgi:hypothetical protein
MFGGLHGDAERIGAEPISLDFENWNPNGHAGEQAQMRQTIG